MKPREHLEYLVVIPEDATCPATVSTAAGQAEVANVKARRAIAGLLRDIIAERLVEREAN